jgi:hypothetical protein
MAPADAWHLEKKVPLVTIILAMAVQAAGGVWFMASLNSQVDQIVRANDLQDTRITQVEQAAQAQAIAGATIATKIGSITDTLGEVRQDQRAQMDMLRQILEAGK